MIHIFTFELFLTQQIDREREREPCVFYCSRFVPLLYVVNACLSSVVRAIHGRVISASDDQPHGTTGQYSGLAFESVYGEHESF